MKLSFHRVSFKYDDRPKLVLTELDVCVNRGDRLGVVGHSGSGKSTLIQLMCGMLKPLSGTVRLGERNVCDVPPAERRVGLVLQKPPAFRGVTVGELLERPASRNRGGAVALTPLQALNRLRMADHYDRPLIELSGGEQQRVHLARVLVWNPDFVVLDEPFSSIDLQIKSLIYPMLRARQEAVGNALVLVTHDPQEALLLCDRILLLKDGRCLAEGQAHELVRRPPNIEAAQILGGYAANILDVVPKPLADGIIELRTPFGIICGRFQAARPIVDLGTTLSGVFLWRDIVPTSNGQEMSPEEWPSFRPLERNGKVTADVPALYERKDQIIYARACNNSSEVFLRFHARRVLLYDKKNGDLVGELEMAEG